MSIDTSDVVSGSAVGLRSRLWQAPVADLRSAAIEASAEILRLEAIRVAVVDELSLRPDECVLCYRGVGRWLAANTMLQIPAGNKIAALGVALRAFPAVAQRFDAGDCSFDHAALIISFCESPPKGMPAEALPQCIDVLLAAASGVDATTTKLRYVIATLERMFESDNIPPAEDIDRNELRIASTLNGRVVVRGDFDAVTGEMLLSALSNLTMPTPAPDGTPDARSAAKRTADGFTELIRRYLDCAKTGIDGGQRPHLNVHINARDLAEHRDCAAQEAVPEEEASLDPDLSDLDVGHMPWMGPLSVSQTRLLGCDCFLSTVLLDDHGAPLDARPGKRLVTAEQRVALIARDKGCAFPGCECVPAWTDAHHIRHWSNGGPTVMNNLVLLCRSHHRLMHRKTGFVGKWEIRMGADNKPWFIPPPAIDPQQHPRPANNTYRT
ncbi:MAG: HNH endonuclease [Rhodococcus sp. (in: high G+C Gram-positive bacteria)]|uniref:HNH endonuclease signature motif containing protein n=1 Tax=Rhodococcus sp. TaxID=1831 RepID=UPI00120A111F|nr:HNH endonuclease signature motif containing protein [Rhodococcus sp. (in: high G+C Gram-positive bacteria)]RZL21929.1 MAG: HNH endonuclease [Rhodococcus sp. (in: high G+C Gram-positive bacteria)]